MDVVDIPFELHIDLSSSLFVPEVERDVTGQRIPQGVPQFLALSRNIDRRLKTEFPEIRQVHVLGEPHISSFVIPDGVLQIVVAYPAELLTNAILLANVEKWFRGIVLSAYDVFGGSIENGSVTFGKSTPGIFGQKGSSYERGQITRKFALSDIPDLLELEQRANDSESDLSTPISAARTASRAVPSAERQQIEKVLTWSFRALVVVVGAITLTYLASTREHRDQTQVLEAIAALANEDECQKLMPTNVTISPVFNFREDNSSATASPETNEKDKVQVFR
tara:strand:- start:3080 stop:3919 length:840 start_codon:yes stop_codon:yes gene_type:complete